MKKHTLTTKQCVTIILDFFGKKCQNYKKKTLNISLLLNLASN